MAYGDNFLQALATARRQAQVAGRPLSQQETAGIAEGAAASAGERAAQLKALAEQERSNRANEQLRRQEMQTQEEQATKSRRTSAISSGATTGAIAGGYLYGVPGAIIGGVAGGLFGAVSDSSWLCGATADVLQVTKDAKYHEAIVMFQSYVKHAYPRGFKLYLEIGPEIVAAIKKVHGAETPAWYEGFYSSIVMPVLQRQFGAFQAYVTYVRDVIIPTYTPQYAEAAKMASDLDEQDLLGVS